ncbi:hypothetical protein Tco_1398674 [Tanacetum coccineum]
MTYLKHVGSKKHAELKSKSFAEIKAMYEKLKRFDEGFTAIGSAEDERKIEEMNKGASDSDKRNEDVNDDETAKVPTKHEETDTIDSEVMETKSLIASINKVSSPDKDYLVVYRANGSFRAFNCLQEKEMIKVNSRIINKTGRLLYGDYMSPVEFAHWSLQMEQSSICWLREDILSLKKFYKDA